MRLHSGLLAIAVLASLFPKSAEASPIIFTDRATFNAVVQPNVFVGFDTFDKKDFSEYCPPESLPICGGVADGILGVTSDEFEDLGLANPFGGNLTLPGGWHFGFAGLGLVESGSFPEFGPAIPFTAVGFDVIQSSATGLSFLFGEQFFHPTGFIGFLFATPYTSPTGIDVARSSGPLDDNIPLVLDNFVFKTVPVPEPSTLLLFGSALALVQGVRHRKSIFSFQRPPVRPHPRTP